MGGGPADLISKIISENNGIREGVFETLHYFCIPIEKKNAAEATKMICSVLGEGAVEHKTCKKWF